jgi:hypothetical protein
VNIILNEKLMQKIITIALAMIALQINAQKSNYDLNGKFSGKRYQYTEDQKNILQTFHYEFDLKQEADKVFGTSSILNDNGDYADILIKGIIVGDKFHFSEYEIKSEAQPNGKVWCLKSGELNIVKDKSGNTKLQGATPSYMPIYFYPCTGGFTDVSRAGSDDENKTLSINDSKADIMQLTVFPNPFFERTTISYTLTEKSNVSLEVIDISGKRIALLEDKKSKAEGAYSINFQQPASVSGVFIAKLSINGKVFSKQMVAVN